MFHIAAASLQWLKDKEFTFLGKQKWCQLSSDLNPIENLWTVLKEEICTEPASAYSE